MSISWESFRQAKMFLLGVLCVSGISHLTWQPVLISLCKSCFHLTWLSLWFCFIQSVNCGKSLPFSSLGHLSSLIGAQGPKKETQTWVRNFVVIRFCWKHGGDVFSLRNNTPTGIFYLQCAGGIKTNATRLSRPQFILPLLDKKNLKTNKVHHSKTNNK